MRKASIVALLLLGACAAALAEDAATLSKKYHSHTKEPSYKDGYGKEACRDGIDGKDGKDGRPGERGPEGKPGRPGKPGKPGKDGKSALVDIAYSTSAPSRANVSCVSEARTKHFLAQLAPAVAKCDSPKEKAVACSCDTGMVPAFAPLPAKDGEYSAEHHSGDWVGKVNSITLVKNALSKSAGSAVNDQCTCVAQYQATVSCTKDADYYEEEEKEYSEDGYDDEEEEPQYPEQKSYKAKKTYKKKHYSKAAIASYYDWTRDAPKFQAFSVTATVTCLEIKEVYPSESSYEDDKHTYPGEEESYESESKEPEAQKTN